MAVLMWIRLSLLQLVIAGLALMGELWHRATWLGIGCAELPGYAAALQRLRHGDAGGFTNAVLAAIAKLPRHPGFILSVFLLALDVAVARGDKTVVEKLLLDGQLCRSIPMWKLPLLTHILSLIGRGERGGELVRCLDSYKSILHGAWEDVEMLRLVKEADGASSRVFARSVNICYAEYCRSRGVVEAEDLDTLQRYRLMRNSQIWMRRATDPILRLVVPISVYLYLVANAITDQVPVYYLQNQEGEEAVSVRRLAANRNANMAVRIVHCVLLAHLPRGWQGVCEPASNVARIESPSNADQSDGAELPEIHYLADLVWDWHAAWASH